MLKALKNRDYRLLFSGQSISAVGDQFHMVALPWLVLALTHDPAQLGFVLAAAGIPRAALMLVGGAWADRFSPRTIMLVSDALRGAVALGLTAAIVTGHTQLWMVYVLAIAFGTVSGFFLPAAQATVPRLLPDAELEGGNSLMMISQQLATFVGPAIAGSMIALLSGAAGSKSLTGVAIALGIDGLSFVVSALALAFMGRLPGLGASDKHPLAEVADGLRYVATHPMLRMLVGIIALANLLVTGPLLVGVPVLAATRYTQGAAAFGTIVSAYALGNLFGMVGSGTLPRLSDKAFGVVSSVVFVVFAGAFTTLGFAQSMWVAALVMVLAGMGNGYIAVLVMTSMQRLAPKEMVGRVMSLVMLSMVGLAPISQAVAGLLIKVTERGLFSAVGVGLLFTAGLVFSMRSVWKFPEVAEAADVEVAVAEG